MCVKDHHTLPNDLPLVKNACVRQEVLDKWLTLMRTTATPSRRAPGVSRVTESGLPGPPHSLPPRTRCGECGRPRRTSRPCSAAGRGRTGRRSTWRGGGGRAAWVGPRPQRNAMFLSRRCTWCAEIPIRATQTGLGMGMGMNGTANYGPGTP